LARRAKSYSDFYDIVTAKLSKGGLKKKRRRRRDDSTWEALGLPDPPSDPHTEDTHDDAQGKALLLASQQEYMLVKDHARLPYLSTDRGHVDCIMINWL
jgi:conserved oligomeric Golgi complex subunit 3